MMHNKYIEHYSTREQRNSLYCLTLTETSQCDSLKVISRNTNTINSKTKETKSTNTKQELQFNCDVNLRHVRITTLPWNSPRYQT